MFYLLLRPVTLIEPNVVTYFPVPLVAGRVNYRPVSEPCKLIGHFYLYYAHLCEKQVICFIL